MWNEILTMYQYIFLFKLQTSSGKTVLLKNFLLSLPSICSQPKAHTILFYSHMQDEYIEMKNKSLVDTFIQGYPGLEAIQEMIEPYKSSNGTFLLFDGLFSQLLIS